MDDAEIKILSAMQRLCSRQECCSSAIAKKLKDKYQLDQKQSDEILSSLKADKYLDDSRYAAAFARDKAAISGWGTVKIRYQLRAKGISDEDIRAALGEIDSLKASAVLEKLLLSKWKILKDDPQGRLKLIKYALSRGYEYDAVQNLLRNLTL